MASMKKVLIEFIVPIDTDVNEFKLTLRELYLHNDALTRDQWVEEEDEYGIILNPRPEPFIMEFSESVFDEDVEDLTCESSAKAMLLWLANEAVSLRRAIPQREQCLGPVDMMKHCQRFAEECLQAIEIATDIRGLCKCGHSRAKHASYHEFCCGGDIVDAVSIRCNCKQFEGVFTPEKEWCECGHLRGDHDEIGCIGMKYTKKPYKVPDDGSIEIVAFIGILAIVALLVFAILKYGGIH